MIYLMRHGETTWNTEGRYQGHLDSSLTPKGIEQARAAGQFLRSKLSNFNTVCIEVSPLGRARQTATILCEKIGLDASAIVISPLLVEHSMGTWQGLTNTEVDDHYPGAREARGANKWSYIVPGGESYSLIDIRAKQWLEGKRHAPVTIAVTHEMLSRTIQGAYKGLTPKATLLRSHPHDCIYYLHEGQIEEFTF